MRGGRALLAAARAPSPLERLLAATRAAIGLLADALRPSLEPTDTPVITLGSHYISVREVAEGECHIKQQRWQAADLHVILHPARHEWGNACQQSLCVRERGSHSQRGSIHRARRPFRQPAERPATARRSSPRRRRAAAAAGVLHL